MNQVLRERLDRLIADAESVTAGLWRESFDSKEAVDLEALAVILEGALTDLSRLMKRDRDYQNITQA